GPAGFLRFDPATGLSEVYHLPKSGYGIRGGDIDKNGVVWGSASNGSLVSFDRRKCKGPLNGPNATGDHCPEGFAFHRYPGPGFEGEPTSAEASYYTWVDQHNTLGLGEDVPISTANLNDGFVALKDGQMVMLRIPYPIGFYAKGLDGRIDDPNAGWKGRGLWSTNGDRTPWLMEGGKGSKPRAVHIQLRPDPIAQAALDDCKGRGYATAVVVVDRGGNTMVALRGDNASAHTMENARRKAYTAMTFKMTTADFIKEMATRPVRREQTTLPNVIAI